MLNIINYIGESDDRDYVFIRGHLYLEALMTEIIKKTYKDSDSALEIGKMFYNKIKLLKAIGIIDKDMENLLLEINKIRNKMAHNMEYRLSFDDLYNLIIVSYNAKVNYSDDNISEEYYCKRYYFDENETIGVTELMSNTFHKMIIMTGIFTNEEIDEMLC